MVDKEDKAFQTPVKPIGMFYTKQEADRMEGDDRLLRRMPDMVIVECHLAPIPFYYRIAGDSTIGQSKKYCNYSWRRRYTCRQETDTGYQGIAAVIDKDKSSGTAEDLNADMLIILTAVERVCIHYKKENQQELTNMTVSQARTYIQQGHFAPGSMLPKESKLVYLFVEQTKNGTAIITSLDCAKEALLGKTGTKKIVND